MKKVSSPFLYVSTTMDPHVISPPKFWLINFVDKHARPREIIIKCPGVWSNIDVHNSMRSIADEQLTKIISSKITSNEDYNYDMT